MARRVSGGPQCRASTGRPEPDALELIHKNWDPATGDARQELVLIGIGMDEDALRARLDECLLTENEMRSRRLVVAEPFRDPFPSWNV